MSKCYTWNNETMSSDQVISKAIKEIEKYPLKYKLLRSTLFKTATEQGEITEQLEKIESSSSGKSLSKEYMGVNRYIDLERRDSGLSIPVRLAPIYNEENRINEYIKQETSRSDISEEEARAAILQTIQDEKLATDIGSIIHKFMEIGFKSGAASDAYENYKTEALSILTKKEGDKTLFDLITEQHKGNATPEKIINQIAETTKALIKDLKLRHQNAQFFPEFEMASDNAVFLKENLEQQGYTGIVGKADLVVVTQEGQILIYDFKTSCRHFGENGEGWYAAKLNHTDYQLGFYRQILADRNVKNIENSKLIIQPIYFDRKNIIDTLTVEKENNRTSASNNKNRLNYYFGSLISKINEYIHNNGADATKEGFL